MNSFADETHHGAVYSALSFVFIALYIPSLLFVLSVTVRRLHDLDMNGWWLLIIVTPFGLGFLVLLFICSRKGTLGPNRFGGNPLYFDVFEEVEEFG